MTSTRTQENMCFYECFSWLLPLQHHKKNDDVVYEQLPQEEDRCFQPKSADPLSDNDEWEEVV